MNREILKAKIAEVISSTNKSGNEKLEAILAVVDAYSLDGNGAKPIVSGSLPPLPDWDEVIKGIDDSRFDDMPNCYAVREGARIMYDRLYCMLSRRQ